MIAQLTNENNEMQERLAKIDSHELEKLRDEVRLKENQISEIEEKSRNSGTRVEKQLVKNILLSFFQTPLDKQFEVLPILGALVDFTQEDYQKAVDALSTHQTNSSWLGGWLGTSKPKLTIPTSNQVKINSERSLPSSAIFYDHLVIYGIIDSICRSTIGSFTFIE